MAIRYTAEEWEKLPEVEQLTRQDLAPTGGLEGHKQAIKAALESDPDFVTIFALLLQANAKAQKVVDYYKEKGNTISKAEFVRFIEQQNFTALDIAELVGVAVGKRLEEKRQAAKSKDTGWLSGVIEQWLKEGHKYATKEEFCEYYAEAFVERPDGEKVQAPKAETIRKQLTEKNIARHVSQQDAARRRKGIS